MPASTYGHASSDESEQSKSLARNRKSCTGIAATKGQCSPLTSENSHESVLELARSMVDGEVLHRPRICA
jgi:hypothetical protein